MGSGSSTSNIKPINTAELGQTQETPSCQDSATETTAGRADKSCDGVGRPLPALTNTIVQVMTRYVPSYRIKYWYWLFIKHFLLHRKYLWIQSSHWVGKTWKL